MSIHETSFAGLGAFDLPVVPPHGPMTEDDFVAWCREHDDVRAELANGEIIIMSPANIEHQRLIAWLHKVLGTFVERRDLGEVIDDFQIRLASVRSRRVPDLLFISNSRTGLIQQNHLEGAPDLAVEIVSPDSADRDWREKYSDYQTAGVREYWIIEPPTERVEVYALDSSGTYQRLTEQGDKLVSTVVEGFFLRSSWLWPKTRPKSDDALRELTAV